MLKEVPMLVLTGGPCSGKTTGMCYLEEKLLDYGLYPILITEAPTFLMNMGITPKDNIFELPYFEQAVLDTTLMFERIARHAAKNCNKKNIVTIGDRGIMDIRAYAGKSFYDLVASRGLSVQGIMGKYEAVFHLRTAALGAEEHYNSENNKHRFENLDQARVSDEKTLNAWIGHNHLRIIDNSTDFEGKMKRLLRSVCNALSIPAPLEIERKFLINPVDLNAFGIYHQEIEIEQVYITSPHPDEIVRIRKRGQGSDFIYYHTTKKALRPGVRIEKEYKISRKEYEEKLCDQLEGTAIVKKKRCCFAYKNQYFELDTFESPHKGLSLLEIELTDEHDTVSLPDFIHIQKEVTDDNKYTNRELAHI